MVEIKPYNPKLAEIFAEKAAEIREDLGEDVAVEHVGSSAVKIGGKNIVDILIGVDNNDEMIKAVAKLEKLGYFSGGATGENRFFMASSMDETKEGDVHLHIAVKDSPEYRKFIVLRDFLLRHPERAQEYYQAKIELAEQAGHDRKTYKALKAEYVDRLMAEAEKTEAD